jgi:predicted transcriptional regulator
MTVVELKEKLIEKINGLDNENALTRIGWMIDIEGILDNHYEMSPDEEEAVKKGLDDLDTGRWISNEEANKRADEWLRK